MLRNKQTKALIDVCFVVTSVLFAYLLRFDLTPPREILEGAVFVVLASIFIKIPTFYFFGLYRGVYHYTSLWDLINILKATAIGSVIMVSLIGISRGLEGIPRSIFLLDLILTILLISVARVGVRIYYSHIRSLSRTRNFSQKRKLLLLGAGNTGEKIAREVLQESKAEYQIVGFLDDNPQKQNVNIHGIPVLGRINDLQSIDFEFDEIIITAPSATGDQMRHIVEQCELTGKKFKTVPGFHELINKDVSIKTTRDVSLMDLLGRAEVSLNSPSINAFIKGKRILVTGAGGSIGSELVRQCSAFSPGSIILVDNSEQNLFEIEQKFSEEEHTHRIIPILANIQNKELLEKIFKDNRPQVILHAAAYKHVPIQELNPWAGVMTNVVGTLNLVELSTKYKAKKFVLVSTDKAVHPVNVMGATKRLAEKIIQTVKSKNNTQFFAVRFGNVIGSSGSVIPTFKKQIDSGGPVTVTHPEMYRYFMSISEAAQLILQTGAIGQSGQIFLLDMGKPIKIVDMARDLIKLSGFEPEKDIPIIYTGLRPGEKLYEELKNHDEKIIKTDFKKIMILDDKNDPKTWPVLVKEIGDLKTVCQKFSPDLIKSCLKQLLPEYSPQDFIAIERELDLSQMPVKGQA